MSEVVTGAQSVSIYLIFFPSQKLDLEKDFKKIGHIVSSEGIKTCPD